MNDNVYLSGQGVLNFTFLSNDFEAKKAKYFKNLFLQIACRNGLTPEWFKERFGVLPLGGANFAGAVIALTV